MLNVLALLTRERYWRLHSWLIKWLLRMRGIRVGRAFHIRGVPRLKIRGRARHIRIGDHVTILGDIDLRNRENGRIVFENHVTIEENCRFVAAREGEIRIGAHSVVCAYAVFNGGADIQIGRKCIMAVRLSINANEHLHSRRRPIREQGFLHAPVIIEEDCWIGTNVSINKGVCLKKGSIIGANAVVTRDTEPYSINVGIPARQIGERPDT